jgi:hypothetical protein
MENQIQVNLSQRITIIRGQEVILDFDLAKLYEVDNLVSQNVIAHIKVLGGAKPMAFTEQGVAMLSSVLRWKDNTINNFKVFSRPSDH